MLPKDVAFLTVVAMLSSPVTAGSRAWESLIQHEVQLDRRRFAPMPVDEAGYAIRASTSNASKVPESHRKRWLAIKPGAGSNPTYLWPNKTLTYCFDTESSLNKIQEGFNVAIKLREAAGLSREVYKYVQLPDIGSACTNNPNRDKILVISHNTDGIHATSPGRRPLDANYPEFKGPTMRLSQNVDVGQLNQNANWAHEIGHAWGLFHEHQNPRFWGVPYGTSTSDIFAGEVFGARFDCSALKDYDKVMAAIDAKHSSDGQAAQIKIDVCTKHGAAEEWNFSAFDWLPITTNILSTAGVPEHNAGYDTVDWESIMMYPSGAGGRGTARARTGPDDTDYDQRQPVLLRNDGMPIGTNAVPSALDVIGIKHLYEGSLANQKGEPYVLPNDKKHRTFGKFMKDMISTKGKSCEAPKK